MKLQEAPVPVEAVSDLPWQPYLRSRIPGRIQRESEYLREFYILSKQQNIRNIGNTPSRLYSTIHPTTNRYLHLNPFVFVLKYFVLYYCLLELTFLHLTIVSSSLETIAK